MTKERGIDVSAHQGKIDWKRVKASGITFAILRAGYGNDRSQQDSCFAYNYQQAKANGISVGVYWFSYAISPEDAKTEAAVCCQILEGKQLDLPVFYDWEADSLRYCRAMGIEPTKAMTTAFAHAFCKEIERHDYGAGIYSNLSDLQQYFDLASLQAYPLWLAQWEVSAPDRDCAFWQYSDKIAVDGIAGKVDGNYRLLPKQKTAKTTAELRLRTEAHIAAKVQRKLPKGASVLLLEDDDWGWSRVQYGSQAGWVKNRYLNDKTRSGYRIGTLCKTAALRDTASRGGTILEKLPKGTTVEIVCILPSNWLYVKRKQQKGYLLYDGDTIAIGGKVIGK